MARKKGLPESLVVSLPASAPAVTDGPLVSATRLSLQAVDREATPHGQAALALAARVDAGHEHGSAVAALVRELRATLTEAMAGVRAVDDVVDELRARRERRRA